MEWDALKMESEKIIVLMFTDFVYFLLKVLMLYFVGY